MSEYSVANTTSRGLGDEVIYFRRPFLTRDGEPAENAGWITWADSLSGTKLRDYEVRGFTPLRKYGQFNKEARLNRTIEKAQDENWTPRQFQSEWLWGAILRHPDGPAEFPLEQILALRWYERENCPLRDVDPVKLFPQLNGHRIKKHRCPQCRRTFAEVDGKGAGEPFANHLRIMHDYDMTNILAYGEKIGLDFTGIEYGGDEAEELVFGEPAAEELVCEECGQTFSGRMAEARLAKHVKAHGMVPV